ncbi:hypothetical protein BaRGS_00021538, partial [Batillaria attramentaria]
TMACQEHNKEVLRRARKGDIIVIQRRLAGRHLYSHFAIYAGDGEVRHKTSDKDHILDKAVIKGDDFWTVVGDDRAEIENMLDKWLKPYPAEVVLARATRDSSDERRYNVLTNNCEHFVTSCRYGYAYSEQAEPVLNRVKIILEKCQLSEKERDCLMAISVSLYFPMKSASDQGSQTLYYESSNLNNGTDTSNSCGQGNARANITNCGGQGNATASITNCGGQGDAGAGSGGILFPSGWPPMWF